MYNIEIKKALNELSNEDLIKIVREFDNQTISQEALIRKVASSVFNVPIDKTTMNMMMVVISHSSISLADRLQQAIDYYNIASCR